MPLGGFLVAMNLGLDSLPPVLFAAIKYDIASLTLISTALILRKDIRRNLSAISNSLPLERVDYYVPSIFLFVGQQYVTSASRR